MKIQVIDEKENIYYNHCCSYIFIFQRANEVVERVFDDCAISSEKEKLINIAQAVGIRYANV